MVDNGALFNLEQVPSETLFYTTLLSTKEGALEQLKEKLETKQFIQVGGDATTGLGFCTVTCKEIN